MFNGLSLFSEPAPERQPQELGAHGAKAPGNPGPGVHTRSSAHSLHLELHGPRRMREDSALWRPSLREVLLGTQARPGGDTTRRCWGPGSLQGSAEVGAGHGPGPSGGATAGTAETDTWGEGEGEGERA